MLSTDSGPDAVALQVKQDRLRLESVLSMPHDSLHKKCCMVKPQTLVHYAILP